MNMCPCQILAESQNFKGKMLGFVLSNIGKGVLEKAFKNSVIAIEARNAAVSNRAA